MPWKPPTLARVLAQVILGGLCLLGVAEAAVPLSLPPGELASDWQAAAVRAGFSLGPLGSGVGVELVVVGAGWEIRVHDAEGGVRRVPVAAPKTAREREDLLWVAASLAVPLESQAPTVPLPVIPITPPAPTPPAEPPARAPSRRAPEPTPTTTSPTPPVAQRAPPAEPTPPPPTPPAEPTPPPTPPKEPVAQPEEPEEATVDAPSDVPELAPLLSLTGGLALGGALDEGQAVDLMGHGELVLGAWVEERWLVTLSGAGSSASGIGLLGDTEEIRRLDLSLGGGLTLGGSWGPWVQARLGLGLLRFSSGEPSTSLGGLRVPSAGMRVGLARPLGGGFEALGELGLDRDLRAVRLVKSDGSASVLLAPSHLVVGLGLRWSPE